MAIAAWMLSAALAVWLPGMRPGIPRGLLGVGWSLSFAALGCTFVGFQSISRWSAAGSELNAAPKPCGCGRTLASVLALASTVPPAFSPRYNSHREL